MGNWHNSFDWGYSWWMILRVGGAEADMPFLPNLNWK